MGGGAPLFDQPLSENSTIDESSSSSDDSEASSFASSSSYLDLLRSYENPPARTQTLEQYKDAILRHKPGDWIEEVAGLTAADYDVPEVTALLLVGPRGSGKSSLVNRISRVFEEDKFAPDRAQVSHNLLATNGSCFLQEYMIPRCNKSLCFYDTRSLSTCKYENLAMLNRWMTKGVIHGEMVIRDSDTILMKENIKAMARTQNNSPCKKRSINFVIFVVDGVSVLKSMNDKDVGYDKMLVESFNLPYLSFKDHKPAVVVTHGDELSFCERSRVRDHLGNILGIPPSKQIFDIPDSCDYNAELAIVDMLRYSIEHADRNLPYNVDYTLEAVRTIKRKAENLRLDDWVMVLEILIICICVVFCIVQFRSWVMGA